MAFSTDRALFAINFVELLKLTDDFYGQPFKLLGWQHDALYEFYGQSKANNLRQYNYMYLEIPKKNGKALAIDTRIPTPDGWKLMRDMNPGDVVFDENGITCKVIRVSDIMLDRPCYKLIFGDGSTIIADASHQWTTSTYKPWMATRTWTTEEIKHSLIYQDGSNHKIQVSDPIKLPHSDLPISPYVLGAWLGDGTSKSPHLTCHYNDIGILHQIESCGTRVKEIKSSNSNSGCYYMDLRSETKAANGKYVSLLGENGLLKNKHIPSEYLRASVEQRTALLQGLMDTDGYVSKEGQCEFTTTLEILRDGVFELLATLGFKPTIKTDRAMLKGKDCGPKYRIQFWAYEDTPVFRLGRKRERQKQRPDNLTRAKFRKIVDVVPIDSVPVKCIEVDSASRLFLAGEAFIPTHNSGLGSALAIYHTFADGVQYGEVYSCASDRQQASIVFDSAVAMIDQSTFLKKRCKYTASKKEIYDKVSHTKYKVLSSEAYTKHGLKPTAVIFDEIHSQPTRDLWDTMTFGAGSARKEPVWITLTTAGDDPDRNSIGWEVHEYARKTTTGEINDPTWFAKIYGAPEDANIYDEKIWYDSNPSLGHTIQIETVRQEALTARNSEAAERLFRWLRLNQWISLKRVGWQTLTLWDNTVGEWDLSELIGKKCYIGLDLSSTTDITAACYLFPPQDGLPDWRAIFDSWIPEGSMKERISRDQVPYDRWVNQKYLHATPGNVVDYDFVEARLLAANRQYDIHTLGTDPWNSRMLTQHLMKEDIDVIEIAQNMKHMSPAMKMIEQLMKSGNMTHEKNPVARWCWGNTIVAVDGNENIKPMKNKSVDRIDLTVALINAMATAMLYEDMEESVYNSRGLRSI